MAKVNNGTNNTSNNSDQPKTKVWINVGKKVAKSDGSGEYLLSPYYGIPVDTAKVTGTNDKSLHAAIMKKVAELGEGTHDIKLDVQITVLGEEKEVEAGEFDL